jgi:beta-lactam-binding protein with PASTA domain
MLDFDQVLDADERARILAEAEPYLEAFTRKWDERTVVPLALNCDTAQAERIMSAAGLASKIDLVASYRGFPAGVVVGQAPAAGTDVPRGSIVTLVVASEAAER